MFEIGFTELLVIFVLALVVLGPEKLPRLAQQVGRWLGRARAMAKQFREQLEDEVNVADMKKWQDMSSSSTSNKPTSAQPDLGAQPSSPYADSAQTSTSDASDPGPTPSEPVPAAGTPEQPAGSPGHYAGPPPEPEAAAYEPPAYASAPASTSTSTNGTTPHETSSDPAHAVESPPASSPSPASDERPARPGDVITHTHERGI
jgi:sec-independent protein translocase protein TatB